VSAPTLPELQRHFWAALEGETAPELRAVVAGSESLSPDDRIDVYASMYLWRLHDVLADDFPKLAVILGEEGFTDLVRRYLGTCPSSHPSARWVGRRMVEFLEGYPLWAPWLADLAGLEWARNETFDAPDAEPVRATDLAAVAPEEWPELAFEAVPSLAVLDSRWSIHEVWARPEARAAPGAEPPLRPARIRVWRRGWRVLHAAMDDTEAAAFAHLRAGAGFATICERFADRDPGEGAREAGGLLARWVEDGLIASFRRPPS
jgi:Putative DNA-binding domain